MSNDQTRLERTKIVLDTLKELFPTADAHLHADDFYTGDYLFRVEWGKSVGAVLLTIKEKHINEVVSDLVTRIKSDAETE